MIVAQDEKERVAREELKSAAIAAAALMSRRESRAAYVKSCQEASRLAQQARERAAKEANDSMLRAKAKAVESAKQKKIEEQEAAVLLQKQKMLASNKLYAKFMSVEKKVIPNSKK